MHAFTLVKYWGNGGRRGYQKKRQIVRHYIPLTHVHIGAKYSFQHFVTYRNSWEAFAVCPRQEVQYILLLL